MTESKHQCTSACDVSKNIYCKKHELRIEDCESKDNLLFKAIDELGKSYFELSERIAVIENLFAGRSFKPIHDAMELRVDLLDKRVKSVEHLVKHSQDGIEKCFERIETIDKTIHGLIDKIGEMANFYYREKTTPHKCPVCDGEGKDKTKLVAEPYDQQIKILVNPPCHSCEGKGIVWG